MLARSEEDNRRANSFTDRVGKNSVRKKRTRPGGTWAGGKRGTRFVKKGFRDRCFPGGEERRKIEEKRGTIKKHHRRVEKMEKKTIRQVILEKNERKHNESTLLKQR